MLRAVLAGGLAAAAGSTAWAQFTETEPNETKAQANTFSGLSNGSTITGNTTGTSTTVAGAASADTFLISTAALPQKIYRHRLTLTTTGTAGHTGTIRGLTQSARVINLTSDATVQTSSTTTTPARFVQWYGFGRQEQLYYRVTGGTATTANYVATLSTVEVTPTTVPGAFLTGSITISGGAGNTVDTDFWIYDSQFAPVPDAGVDDTSAGTTGTLTTTLAPGTYYVAYTDYNMANDQAASSSDTFLSGNVMDFKDIVVNSSTTIRSTMPIRIRDAVNDVTVPLSKAGEFDVVWVRFIVGNTAPPGGSGVASPSSSPRGSSVTVTVNTIDSVPPAAITSVRCDLSAYGIAAPLTLVNQGGNVWSQSFIVPPASAAGVKSIPFSVVNVQGTGGGVFQHVVTADIYPGLRIGRVYGGGGLNSTTPNADYVVIYNGSGATRNLNGYTVQLAGATSAAWTAIPLSGNIANNGYLLVQCETASATGTALPTPDINSTTSPLISTGGKVALVASPSPLTTASPIGDPSVVDFVGYGTATAYEGGGAATPSITSLFAAERFCSGTSDTDDNSVNFQQVNPNGPQNSSTPSAGGLDVQIASISPSPVGQDGLITIAARPLNCADGTPILGASCVANLTNLGASGAVTMFDNSTNGDATAGDGTYTCQAYVGVATPLGSQTFTVSASSGTLTGGTTGSVTVTAAITGGCCTGSSCNITTARQCSLGGGTYLGDGISCTPAANFFLTDSPLPATIPDNSPGAVVLNITVPPSNTAVIDQLRVVLDMSHTWIGDLSANISNGTTTVTLFDRVGRDGTVSTLGDSSNFAGIYTFADAGADMWAAVGAGDSTYNLPSGVYRPSQATDGALPSPSLAAFDGTPFAGTWTLTLGDNAAVDTGTVRGFRIESTASANPCGGPRCPGDYNVDNFVNLDDLGDFITDYYTIPAIPGGAQANAPQYPGVNMGYGQPCPNAPDAPAPYAANAYRTNGYRVGYSGDGSNSCPLSPAQPFPNLDNLGDFITFYYSRPVGPC
jgi:subtilisin-like proprotein convertase family protein